MKPHRIDSQYSLFNLALEKILNPDHPLVILSAHIDWSQFDDLVDECYLTEGDDAHQLWGRGVFYVYPRACCTPTGLQKRPAVRVLKGGRTRLSAHAHLELAAFAVILGEIKIPISSPNAPTWWKLKRKNSL